VSMDPFPSIPKKMRKWVIRPTLAVEDMLNVKHYPPIDAISSASNIQALRMMYQLPSYIYISSLETISIGWWDASTGTWTDKDVSEQDINLETKIVQFKIKKIAPVSVLLPRNTDFPFTSWFLRCVSNNKAILEVTGKRMEFRFVITGGYMEFVDTQNLPELAHLRGLKSSPGFIVLEMKKCGILLLPEDRDGPACSIMPKTAEAEERALFDMSLATRTFAFMNTHWNKELEPDRCAIRMRENLEYDEFFAENEEADWRTVGWWPNKCSILGMKESDEELNSSVPEEHETHLTLELALKGNCTPQA
jgi:cancer susceptibility candidate protein 1